MKLFEIGLFLVLHNSVNIYIGHCTTKLFPFIYEKWVFLVAFFFFFFFFGTAVSLLVHSWKDFFIVTIKEAFKAFV